MSLKAAQPSDAAASTNPKQQEHLLRVRGVLARVPVSRSGWFAGVKSGRFPKPVRLGPKTVAWRASDIDVLIENGV